MRLCTFDSRFTVISCEFPKWWRRFDQQRNSQPVKTLCIIKFHNLYNFMPC
jgi:hypothetical protein